MTILTDHAKEFVWAEPLQDFQHKIKPTRISPNTGYYKQGTVMWEMIPMPNYRDGSDNTKYHVYPLGQLPPRRFALEMVPLKWYRGDDLAITSNNVIDVYVDNGCVIQRDKFWICQNYDKNLILAVSTQPGDIGVETITTPYDEVMEVPYSLTKHDITIRFYHNALLENNEWMSTTNVPEQPLTDVRKVIKNVGDYTSFVSSVNAVNNRYGEYGEGIYFLDGYLINKPTGYHDDMVGKTLAYQYDETVKSIRDFPLATIPGFSSILDPRQDKYLCVSDRKYTYLDYFDDCDFYLIHQDIDGKVKGVRIDVFGTKIVRQVTHTAWSVNQNEVIRLANLHRQLNNVHLLTIRVVVRQGGMIRGFGLQRNRLEELYHLDNEQIKQAMVGVNATIPEWQAAELENSAYMRLMSASVEDITEELVEEAYGYNAMTRAVAKATVIKKDGAFTLDSGFNIPVDSRGPNPANSKTQRVFSWYDKDGYYLGRQSNTGTGKFAVPNTTELVNKAEKLEVQLGTLSTGIAENGTITDTEKTFDTTYGYYGHRCYVCNIVGGGPDHHWSDVTGSVYYTYVTPEDGSTPYIQWNYNLLNAANLYPAVRFANTVNHYTPTYTDASFTGVYEYVTNRLQNGRILPFGVPPGRIDIIMNGKSLIQGLDFHYTGSGKVYIVKKPTTAVDKTDIVIRMYGYMNPLTKKPFTPRAVGFVKNGILTVNKSFDIFHDRDLRVIMNGRFLRTEEAQFAEDNIDPNGPIYKDGYPFALDEYQTLLEPFALEETIPATMDAMDIDERVGKYLTERIEPIEPEFEYVTPERHILYSPVMSMFTKLMISGRLNDSAIDIESTDQSILEEYGTLVSTYQDVDPILLGYDNNYVYIEPHVYLKPVEITSKQHAFLERVNRIFLGSTLDISGHYTIKAGT